MELVLEEKGVEKRVRVGNIFIGEKERKGTRFTSFSLFLSLSFLSSPRKGREKKRKRKRNYR